MNLKVKQVAVFMAIKNSKYLHKKHTEGTEYETIITFNETDITIKKKLKRNLKKYSKEYKFNIDDVLYVTNTKHLSTFYDDFYCMCNFSLYLCIWNKGIIYFNN